MAENEVLIKGNGIGSYLDPKLEKIEFANFYTEQVDEHRRIVKDVSKEFNETVTKLAAEHLLTKSDNVNIIVKHEPISNFKEEIGRALDIIEQHPDAVNRRDKIIAEIKAGGEIMPMYYGINKNTGYSDGTTLPQLLACHGLGIKTIPIAYITKKSIVEDKKQFDADKSMFTTIDAGGHEDYDNISHDYHQAVKEHAELYGHLVLNESINKTLRKKLLAFYNSINTIAPAVNDKVFVLELMYINVHGIDTIVEKGELSESEVIGVKIKVIGEENYIQYTIKNKDGRETKYPSGFEAIGRLARTFFFTNLEDLQKVRTAFGISFKERVKNELNEGVGVIVGGANTTKDVDENSTKR